MHVLLQLALATHLLSMAAFVASFVVQRRVAPTGRLVGLWPLSVLFINASGVALIVISILVDEQHSPVKMGIKGGLMTILGVWVLILYFRKTLVKPAITNSLGAMVLAEVVVSTVL